MTYSPSAVIHIFPSASRHRPSSMTSISPWYSVWEGSTLRKGRMTFPRFTVASISSPSGFTTRGKELVFFSMFSNKHQNGINESLTWSHFGNLFSTDFVSLPLRGQVLHSVSQFQAVQVSTNLTEETSDPTDLKRLLKKKIMAAIPYYH